MALRRLSLMAATCLCIAVKCAYARAEDSAEADPIWGEDMARKIQAAFKSLAQGLAEEGLPPMDPVVMRDVVFCRGYGEVRANIDFPYSTLGGVSDVSAVSHIRCAPGASQLEFRTHHHRIVQEGLYNLTGSFADVFAVGKGDAHIVLRDVTIHHRLQWRRARGELRVKEYRGAVQPRDMTVRYSNLRAESRDVLQDECRRQQHDGGAGGPGGRGGPGVPAGRPYRRHRRRRHHAPPRHHRPRRKGRPRRPPSQVDVNEYFNAHWGALYAALSPSVDVAFSLVFREYMEEVLRRVAPLLLACEGLDDDVEY